MHLVLLFCTYNSELKPILGSCLYTPFLWTVHMLQWREWVNNYFCALRERNLETAFHLCVERPVTRTIWEAIGNQADCNCFKPSSWETYSCIIDWFRNVIGRTKTGAHSLAILIIWSGWKERNKRIFRWQEISIQALVGGIQDEVRNWCSEGDKLLRPLIVKPISE